MVQKTRLKGDKLFVLLVGMELKVQFLSGDKVSNRSPQNEKATWFFFHAGAFTVPGFVGLEVVYGHLVAEVCPWMLKNASSESEGGYISCGFKSILGANFTLSIFLFRVCIVVQSRWGCQLFSLHRAAPISRLHPFTLFIWINYSF